LDAEELLPSIRDAFRRADFRLTVHGLREATADDISVEAIRDAIIDGRSEIVEDYPDDPRGASCLMLGWSGDSPIHVVVAYPPEVVVITAYSPDPDRWIDARHRR